jgi:protein-disulfide isomerase
VLLSFRLKKQFPSVRRKDVKKIVLVLFVSMMVVVNVSCAKPDYKKVTNDFIRASSSIKDYTIREVADTSSSNWKAVIVYVKQDRANMPVLFFVSSDGKSIVPNSMVYVDSKPIFTRNLEPEFGRIDFRLTEKDRFVYNPSGKKSVYMFFDPDCPFCNKAKEKLQNYHGEYRVIVKYFPLERIHPGATQKAIREQAEWLKKNRKDLTKDADVLKEAKRMVEEDIMEAQRAEITGVPMYVLEDGTLKQGLF